MTSAGLYGILYTNFLRQSESSILIVQNLLNPLVHGVADGGLQLVLHAAKTFSIGYKSGLLPGHLMSVMLSLSWNHFMTIFTLWHRTTSWIKLSCPVKTHEQDQLVIQQLQVTLAVHHLTLQEELNSPTAIPAETPLHHDLLRVFHDILANLGCNRSKPAGLLQQTGLNYSSTWLSYENITAFHCPTVQPP